MELQPHRKLASLFYYLLGFLFLSPHINALDISIDGVLDEKEWSEASRPRVIKMLHWLDKHMENKEYICLDRYTIADISALVCFDFAKWPQIDIPDDCKNLKSYYERLNSRPSASV